MIDITRQKVAIGKIRIKLYRANILKNSIYIIVRCDFMYHMHIFQKNLPYKLQQQIMFVQNNSN